MPAGSSPRASVGLGCGSVIAPAESNFQPFFRYLDFNLPVGAVSLGVAGEVAYVVLTPKLLAYLLEGCLELFDLEWEIDLPAGLLGELLQNPVAVLCRTDTVEAAAVYAYCEYRGFSLEGHFQSLVEGVLARHVLAIRENDDSLSSELTNQLLIAGHVDGIVEGRSSRGAQGFYLLGELVGIVGEILDHAHARIEFDEHGSILLLEHAVKKISGCFLLKFELGRDALAGIYEK